MSRELEIMESQVMWEPDSKRNTNMDRFRAAVAAAYGIRLGESLLLSRVNPFLSSPFLRGRQGGRQAGSGVGPARDAQRRGVGCACGEVEGCVPICLQAFRRVGFFFAPWQVGRGRMLQRCPLAEPA